MDFKVSLENGIIDKTIINYILGEIFIVLTIVVVNPKEISEVVSKFTPKLIMSLLQLQAFDFINNIFGMTNEFSNIITTTHSYVFMVIIFILICIRFIKNIIKNIMSFINKK